jgi:hypothetical protein
MGGEANLPMPFDRGCSITRILYSVRRGKIVSGLCNDAEPSLR